MPCVNDLSDPYNSNVVKWGKETRGKCKICQNKDTLLHVLTDQNFSIKNDTTHGVITTSFTMSLTLVNVV